MKYRCETKELAIGYGSAPLASGITLGAVPGQILALIGPNGAGKSTLLKTLAGQLAPLGGAVLLDGRSLTDYTGTARARKLALMLPHTRRTELTSCFEFAAAGRIPYTGRLGILSDADRQAVRDALELVGASPLAGRDFNCISDGQRQRVLLARAICQEPEVIILDEPTSFLDIRHKLELLAILRRMAKEKGITVIMSLHEIDLAQKISDKIICVKGDAISHFGAPETIFREDIIRELYEIDNGSFDPCFGSIELPRPEGTPRVFVLAGGGTGIPVFRKLQKENVPFAAGVLYTNDIDYQLARILAMETVTEAPFQEISDEAFARACELMKSCERVIDTGVPVGMCNRRIEELRAEAKRLGKLAE